MSEVLPVLYERHGAQVAVITLNRQEKKNAITRRWRRWLNCWQGR